MFTLGGVEPDDGRAPLLNFIGGAQESIDVVIYQFDDARIRQALIDAHNRGVAVRVLMSWQLYLKKDEYADPSSRNYNRNTRGFDGDWSLLTRRTAAKIISSHKDIALLNLL